MFRRFFDVSALPIYMAPDAGDGGGGTETETQTEEPKYTEAELQKRIAESQQRWRKGLQRDLREKDKQVAELSAKLEETQKLIDELEAAKKATQKTGEGDDGSGRDKELEGRLELLERKHARQLEDLQKKVAEAEQARAKAEEKAKLTKRDTLLAQALSDAKCVDQKAGYRYFLPDVVWDADEEEWRIETPEGNLVSFAEGVKDLLPDYLKPASTQVGGSGSKTGSPARRQKMNELETAKKVLEECAKEVKARPQDNNALNKWSRQRRIVQSLETALAQLK